MFGSSESDLYAFGNKGAVLHRVSGSWRSETFRQFTGGASGVAGSVVPNSNNELYAVGTQGLLLHFANNGWSTESSLTSLPSNSIAAGNPLDVVAVGANGLILHKY
jgi:hypothetical protein